MMINLTYEDLPHDIYAWPAPLLLQVNKMSPPDLFLHADTVLLYGKNINKQNLMNFQNALQEQMIFLSACCVEDYKAIRLAGPLTLKMKNIAHEKGWDVAALNDIPDLNHPGLLVMDMDGTAIEIECIDEVARLAGVGDDVKIITERAMQGELDFSDSLKQRVTMLKGVDVNILKQVRDQLPLTQGLTALVDGLHALGWHIALVSGGFTYYAEYLREKLSLFSATANRPEIKEKKLTGKIFDPIIDAQYKADTLKNLASRLSIPIKQTIAIGDGANDLNMIREAGLGIAFHVKHQVQSQAQISIQNADLMGLFCILKISSSFNFQSVIKG